MHPSVMPLPIYLPNMQSLQMRPYEQLDAVAVNEKRTRTALTEFFRVKTENPETRLLYDDFMDSFRWDKDKKILLKRLNKVVVIGRLAFLAPRERERFYLCLLLLHVRAPKSFEDLLTVNEQRCATFQEAALKRRLLEEDDAVALSIREACLVQMPAALRRLFATILTFCQTSDPELLWRTYFEAMLEDFKRAYPNSHARIQQKTIRGVEQYLEAMGKTLENFALEHLTEIQDEEIRRTRDVVDALDAPIPQKCVD
ncbi:hypothetical protein vseg_010442 [Gypsophila vaccaria]